MGATYLDLAIKRQVLLERLKSGQFREFSTAFKELEKLIKAAFIELDEDLTELSRTKLEKMISQLKVDQTAVLSSAMNEFAIGLSGIAQLTQEQELEALEKFVDLRGTKLAKFTKIDLQRAILKRPLSTNGDLLSSWQKNFTQTETKRINDVIRLAWLQGETNQQAVRRIVGTRANGFKDGILNITRRNASTVVRTSVQHVASSARMEIWQKNKKVVRGYEWLSTLDRKTSSQCKVLDGKKFEFGKGPIPPIHPNCRSTTVPVTNPKYDFLDEGATRSAEFGPVSAKDNYFDWLKRQDRQTVIDALGEKRAKLFLDGGLSPARFRDLQFDRNFEPLTLDQMKAKEPNAFKKAFGDSAPVTLRKRDKSQKMTKKRGQSIREKIQKRLDESEFTLSKHGQFQTPELLEAEKIYEETTEKYGIDTPENKATLAKVVEIQKNVNKRARSLIENAHVDAFIPKEDRQFSVQESLGDVSDLVNNALGGRIAGAMDFVQRVVHRKYMPKKMDFRHVTEHWDKGLHNSRCFYDPRDKRVYLRSDVNDATIIHEIIHDLEDRNPDISKKTKAFLLKRAKGEPKKKLKDLVPFSSYEDDEFAYEDKWEELGGDVYTGKDYEGQPHTEILTMGIQRLYENPVRFAMKDPEFFDFIVELISQ